jgi:tetratricopeptide (TPR) repeat protein
MKSPGQTFRQSDALPRALDKAAQALRAGRPTEAERFAAPVLAADPENLLAAQVLGAALLMQGRPADALAPLEMATRRSADPSTGIYFARALARVGRKDEALVQLRECAARRPPFVQAFLELGDQLAEAGRYDEAAEVFETGLSLVPEAAVLRIGLGYLHLRRNDRARARELFSEAREAAPQRRDAAIALARVMALDGESAAAVDLFRLALASQPEDPVVRIELGKCLLDLGEREAGEAMLRAGSSGSAQWGPTLRALAAGAHGRFFLRPSAAARFLQAERAGQARNRRR